MNAPVTDPLTNGPYFRTCRSALRQVDRVSWLFVVAAMAGMTSLVVAQVFFRYALSDSIDWAEEFARLFFIWAMFLAIPHGVRRGVHVGIDVVVVMLPDWLKDVLFRVSATLGALLMAVVFYYSWIVTLDTWPELMPTVEVTAAVYYIAVLVAAGHSFMHLSLLAVGGSRSWDEESAS